jgi:hypothetical protein
MSKAKSLIESVTDGKDAVSVVKESMDPPPIAEVASTSYDGRISLTTDKKAKGKEIVNKYLRMMGEELEKSGLDFDASCNDDGYASINWR